MARCLIIGCGRRGQALATELIARGHVVRGTTRRADRLPEIEATGAEAVLADPDRVATLVPALEHVSVAVILLGGATDNARTLHGPRLEMLLTKVLDTTVRAVVYEASGTADPAALNAGAALVTRLCDASRIPYALIDDESDWPAPALTAIEAVLAA